MENNTYIYFVQKNNYLVSATQEQWEKEWLDWWYRIYRN